MFDLGSNVVKKFLTSPEGQQMIREFITSQEGMNVMKEMMASPEGKKIAANILLSTLDQLPLSEEARVMVRHALQGQ